MNETELQTRILADAQGYDPASRPPSRLTPHRDALLLYRAKGLSYEEIAETLTRLGLKIRPTIVGTYCRRNFRKTDILRKRQEIEAGTAKTELPTVGATPVTSFISARRGGGRS
ncbi:MAG: helix-turn-helix transcriptional regulator [Candidatus Didemnitutus sp.]|nr:helix-turn-helix transcriptional regulator [Candidatus Didemnitutus sp.]